MLTRESVRAGYFAMRITHIPTGVSVETGDKPPFRGMLQTKNLLLKWLASKLWFHEQNIDLTKEVRYYNEEDLREDNYG